MDVSFSDYLRQSAEVIAACEEHLSAEYMDRAVDLCVAALKEGKPLLVCGNGGSAADASHIAGELVGRFLKNRKAYKCISLADNASIMTAWSNDFSYVTAFARQVEAYGEKGGVLLAISTSGNSQNVIKAMETAKVMGMSVVVLTGEGGGKMAALCDVLLDAPSAFTPHIQQAHVCYYHYLCGAIEARVNSGNGEA